MKSANEIAGAIDALRIQGDSRVSVCGVTHDSRLVKPNDIFAVLKGASSDGRAFVPDALKKGASALLVDEVLDTDVTQIIVRDVRASMGTAAAVCYDRPTERLTLVGVTGTNGKTTIVYLVESALRMLGKRPGIMSTVAYRYEDTSFEGGFTTPEAPVIQSVAAKMLRLGATHLVMEASSHGIAQHRLNGCRYAVAAFTNLTQDHLDFHKTMEAYGAEKLRLFTEILPRNPLGRAVVNRDDPFSSSILQALDRPVLTASVHPDGEADIRPTAAPRFSVLGIDANIQTPEGAFPLTSPLIGAHNLSNLLVSLGILMQIGESAAGAVAALGGAGAPGRLERVSEAGDPTVLVDYAHTPDALINVLSAVKPLTKGRLICVFGCGGDRDHRKRPLMGRAVRDAADAAVVTSDNPRTEDPADIIEMILPGIDGGDLPRLSLSEIAACSRGYAVEVDRRNAIFEAIAAADENDTVLIAGKGHEDYQILGTKKIHFDDREAAREALAARRKGA